VGDAGASGSLGSSLRLCWWPDPGLVELRWPAWTGVVSSLSVSGLLPGVFL